MAKKKKKDIGRPTKYETQYNDMAYKLTLLGYTDKQLAAFFKIAESTLNLWKKEHPSFSESLTQGKDIADAEVVSAMLKRAKGYDYEEVHKRRIVIEGTGEDAVVEKTIEKHMPSDTAAAMNWLANRQPKKWRKNTDKDDKNPFEGLVFKIIEE